MSFTTITNTERDAVGATTLPDQPTISASALKAKFDEPAKQLLVPKYNTLVGELEASTAASDLGAAPVSGRSSQSTVQAVMNKISSDLATAEGQISSLSTDSHTHSNKAVIDKFNDTGTGLTYDGAPISGAVDSVNGQTGVVVLSASDVGALPSSTSIPSKTSDLTNDSGYITASALPTKTSDLTNDSGFITSAALPTKTSDLTNDSNFVADASYVHTDNNYDATAKGIVDGATAAIAAKSTVTYSQTYTSTGQKIGEITIDGNKTDIIAPNGGGGGGGGAVDSVNGYTGTVVLAASDVGALPSSTVIPTITDTYSATSSDGMSGKAVASAISTKANATHTHTKSDITDLGTIGTAAALDVPASGNASTSQVVKGDDTRLTDSRTPTSHTHTKSDITDFPTIPTVDQTYSSSSTNAQSGTAVAGAISGKANTSQLDEWTSASQVQSDGTVTFTGLNDNYGYDIFAEDILASVSQMTKTGSGTNVTLVYKTDAPVGTSCKLRIFK